RDQTRIASRWGDAARNRLRRQPERYRPSRAIPRMFSTRCLQTTLRRLFGVADLLEPAEEQTYEADFLDYIRGLSQKERRAFDIAMGFVFSKVSDLGVAEPKNAQTILLKASDAPLGSFYNEHRDRRVLFSSDWT